MSFSESDLLMLFRKLLKSEFSEEEFISLKELSDTDKNVRLMLSYLRNEDEFEVDIEAEISYEKSRPNDLNSQDVKGSNTYSFNPLLLRIGVSIAAIFLLVFTYFFVAKKQNKQVHEDWTVVKAKRGERKFFKLIDSTEVWLNNDSELKIKSGYGKQNREIVLKGEAYFSVTKNKDLPMHVSAANTIIEVVGTVFNVRAYPEDITTETSLIEGKVVVQVLDNQDKKYNMVAGDRISIPKKIDPLKRDLSGIDWQVSYTKMDLKDKNSLDFHWINNKLSFNAEPLPIVFNKLSRWYDKKIVMQTENLDNQLFTGVIEGESYNEVFEILKKSGVKINYSIKQDTIFIY